MIIHARAGIASMSEAHNFRSLSIEIEGDPQIAVGSWGTWVDPEHVVVAATYLVELADQAAAEPGWREGFDAMIVYASTKGWVIDGGVRMHVAAPPSM